MRTRIKQRMLRRIALAFAVAAVAAPTAQAVPLEPGATKAEYIPFVTDFPSANTAYRGHVNLEQSDFNPGAVQMPRVTLSDWAAYRDRAELARVQDRTGIDTRGLDGVENVRIEPRGLDNRRLDGVENVRVEPRGLDNPVLVSDTSSFNWGDAGIGAGLALAAIMLAGAAALSVKQHGRLGQV
jgi:hypothetical protein